MGREKNSNEGKTKSSKSRKQYLIDYADEKIKEANEIITNASKKCSDSKIFFISFCLPATAAFVGTLFTLLKDGKCEYIKFLSAVGLTFYLLVMFSAYWSHTTFYATQFRYRKVKNSIETLKEKLTFIQYEIEADITSETFRSYYDAITNVSKKTNKIGLMAKKSFVDSLPFMIPLLCITLFWVVMIAIF